MNVNELLSLKGKIILITGGEGKYGRCIMEGLLEAHGTVITASPFIEPAQKVADEFNAKGYKAFAMYVD